MERRLAAWSERSVVAGKRQLELVEPDELLRPVTCRCQQLSAPTALVELEDLDRVRREQGLQGRESTSATSTGVTATLIRSATTYSVRVRSTAVWASNRACRSLSQKRGLRCRDYDTPASAVGVFHPISVVLVEFGRLSAFASLFKSLQAKFLPPFAL